MKKGIWISKDELYDRVKECDPINNDIYAYESKTQNLIQINDCPLRGVA